MRRDHFARTFEILGFEQMPHALVPIAAFEKMVRAAHMFGGHACQADLRAQTPSQETLKQRMKAILFAARVAGDRQKDVSAHKLRQDGRRNHFGIKPRTGVHFDSIQQRHAHQVMLNVLRLGAEDFFRKVLKDVAL